MSKKKETKKEKKPKIVRIQEYLIRQETDDKGYIHTTRRCDGFNPYEVLGMLERAQLEIIQQLSGVMGAPDDVTRQWVVDDEKKRGK